MRIAGHEAGRCPGSRLDRIHKVAATWPLR
jgi:hypothetical protein